MTSNRPTATGTLCPYEDGIGTLRVGACVDVMLIALGGKPMPLIHAAERGHETAIADRVLVPYNVLRAGKAGSMAQLDNKVALVTGGAHGFGRVLALTLARAGADIAIADMGRTRQAGQFAAVPDLDQIDGVVKEVEALGRHGDWRVDGSSQGRRLSAHGPENDQRVWHRGYPVRQRGDVPGRHAASLGIAGG